jgi:CRISPR-associated protein Csh2
MTDQQTLSSRREFLFLYDIKMGNPNGDPDENRPRVLPDGTHYVTDVRLKRFVRDFLKSQGREILVDSVEGKTTNLKGRVAAYLQANNLPKCQGTALVDILLGAFIDARLFGSSFAFKQRDDKKRDDWKPKAQPKTLTGAVQIQHGEVIHSAQEVDIHGTSVFGSAEDKSQGTFTTYFGLRYALIAFHGIANEHSARLSKMTDADYEVLMDAIWKGVRSAGNTRTKRGQVPRLLVSIQYRPGTEFQFGNLMDYVELASVGMPEKEISSPDDYKLNISRLVDRLSQHEDKIDSVRYCVSPDIRFEPVSIPSAWENMNLDGVMQEA